MPNNIKELPTLRFKSWQLDVGVHENQKFLRDGHFEKENFYFEQLYLGEYLTNRLQNLKVL